MATPPAIVPLSHNRIGAGWWASRYLARKNSPHSVSDLAGDGNGTGETGVFDSSYYILGIQKYSKFLRGWIYAASILRVKNHGVLTA